MRGRLRLWASQTIAGYWLPPFLYRFHSAHPSVTVELHIGNSLQVTRAVLDGAADLGFVEGDIDEPLLAQIPVAVDQLVLVVAKSHEFASLKTGAGATATSSARRIVFGVKPAALNMASISEPLAEPAVDFFAPSELCEPGPCGFGPFGRLRNLGRVAPARPRHGQIEAFTTF